MEEFEQETSDTLIEELAGEVIPARREKVGEALQSRDAYQSLLDEEMGGPPRAQKAFKDYVRLGKGRTLKLLAETYVKPEYDKSVLGESLGWSSGFEYIFRTLKDYSSHYEWQSRLRMIVAKASAEVLAAAQRDAFIHTKERIRLSQEAQEAGILILERANLKDLTEEEARKLLKPAATLLQLGLTQERAEQGDMLTVIRPDKPVESMSDDELQEFAQTIQKALQ